MIKSPDLPNAPMTRWVMYLSLFDFEINHVPAEKHKAPDGLSCQKRAPEDSDEEDAEEYLDKIMGSTTAIRPDESPFLSLATSYQLPAIHTSDFTAGVLEVLQLAM